MKYPETPGYAAGSDTSKAAAQSITVHTIREEVYRVILLSKLHGMTCDEVEKKMGLSHQSVSARIRELALKHRVFDSEERRATRSGRKAVVWLAAPPGWIKPPAVSGSQE